MQSGEISLTSNMWHFQFSIWLKCLFWEVHENPTWLGWVVPKFWAIEGFSELTTIENTKNYNPFFWLYLTINAPDFQLSPQDRNTSDALNNTYKLIIKVVKDMKQAFSTSYSKWCGTMTILLIYKFLSSWRFTFSESR